MKKFSLVILSILFTVLLISCDSSNIKHDKNSVTDDVIVNKNYKATTNEQTATIEKLPEVETLSAEDEFVKKEIAKYSNTEVAFRFNKQEKIQNQKFDICFSAVEKFQGKNELVAYKSDSGDEFLYRINSGDLFLARINSAVEKKSHKSVNIDTAKITADDYVSKKCNIDDFIITSSYELSEGYLFVYTKCISGYKTNATFEIIIGYNNKIVYLRNNTNALNEIDINIDESWIQQTKSDILLSHSNDNAVIEDVVISVENNKPYLLTTISYDIEINGTFSTQKTEIRTEMP